MNEVTVVSAHRIGDVVFERVPGKVQDFLRRDPIKVEPHHADAEGEQVAADHPKAA
jgi:hypothetical protein